MSDESSPRYTLRVSDLPTTDRPRERLERLGPQALTTAELLAILLRTGTQRDGVLQLASQLIREHQGLRGLASADLSTVSSTHGIGRAKATTIAAAFELGRRLALDGDDVRPIVGGPDDIAFTEAVVEAGALLDVRVLDHLIFGRGRFVSLRERRLGFTE